MNMFCDCEMNEEMNHQKMSNSIMISALNQQLDFLQVQQELHMAMYLHIMPANLLNFKDITL